MSLTYIVLNLLLQNELESKKMESDSRHELTKLLKLLQIDIKVGHSRIVNILSEWGGS